MERTNGSDRSGDGPDHRIRRRRFLQASAAAAAVGAAPTPADASGYTTTDYTIGSFDGTDLAATLYEPDDGEAHPAVLMTHGWGSDRGADRVTRKADRYAADGYVVLTYDSRGFGASGGEVGLNGPNEVDDVSVLVDWLADRDGVVLDAAGDPRLGMDGYSYAGAIQLLAAAADDRIDAVVPRITWNDLRYAMAPHGVVKIGWLTLLLAVGAVDTWDFETGSGLDEDLWEWYFEAAWDNALPTDAKEAFADRSVSDVVGSIEAPALLMQGWDDTLFKTTEALRTYRALQDRDVETRIVFYEGGHALEGLFVSDAERAHMNDLALDWMDRHLRGSSTSVPQASLYLKQPGVWREDDQFPPAGVDTSPLYLSATEADDDTYLEKGIWWWEDTYHEFDWEAGADLELVGAPELTLWLYLDGPEARLFFEFYHVDADGHRELINDVGEAYRVEGEEQYHEVQFTFPPFQRFVAEGDRVVLRVSVSNPFYFDSRESEGVWILHSDDYPSRFTLPHRQRSAVQGSAKSFGVGDPVHAAVDDLPVREGPGTGYDVVAEKHVYTSGDVVDGPVDADGSRWWDVHWYEDDGGFAAWAVEDDLEGGARTTERLAVGDRVEVSTGGAALNVRDGPGLGYDDVDAAADGAGGRIVAGPEWNDGDGYAWWKVDYDDYATGWSAQDYLVLE